MNRRNAIAVWFAMAFLIAIPASVHVLFEGQYTVKNDLGQWCWTYWVGPVSNTLPYILLALMFLVHCHFLALQSRRPAYCGAIAAWLGMMSFTVFIVSQTPNPQISRYGGIVVVMTPFLYIPYLVVPYLVGMAVGVFWRRKRRDRRARHEA